MRRAFESSVFAPAGSGACPSGPQSGRVDSGAVLDDAPVDVETSQIRVVDPWKEPKESRE